MSLSAGKIRRTPQPKVEVGQHWLVRNVMRRVTDASDPWQVEFASVVTGKRSWAQRVSKGGSPQGYEFVHPGEKVPVHVRRFGTGRTFCDQPVEPAEGQAALVTATLGNLRWWKERGHSVCPSCDALSRDGIHHALALNEEAA